MMEDPYFYVHSRIGLTKHLNGLAGTKDLSDRCEIGKDSYVLVVGSGSGHSACKIAQLYGCNVVGIDILLGMVESAKDWAERRNLSDKVTFKLGDAMNLSFKSNTFDAVISESVTAFLPDKKKGIKEYYRVLKKGGYVGLGEVTWPENVPDTYIQFAKKAIGGVDPLDLNGWKKLMGEQLVYAESTSYRTFHQAIEEMKMDGIYYFIPIYRMLKLYIFDNKYRKALNQLVRNMKGMPKGLFKNMHSGVYIGRK